MRTLLIVLLLLTPPCTAYAGADLTRISRLMFGDPRLNQNMLDAMYRVRTDIINKHSFEENTKTLMTAQSLYEMQDQVMDKVFETGRELQRMSEFTRHGKYDESLTCVESLLRKFDAEVVNLKEMIKHDEEASNESASSIVVIKKEVQQNLGSIDTVLHQLLTKSQSQQPFRKEVDELTRIVEIIRAAKIASQMVISKDELNRMLELARDVLAKGADGQNDARYNQAMILVNGAVEKFDKVGAVVFVGCEIIDVQPVLVPFRFGL